MTAAPQEMRPDLPDRVADVLRRLDDYLGSVHVLVSRFASRPRTETFMPGSLAPELLRRAEEAFYEIIEHGRAAAALIRELQAGQESGLREYAQFMDARVKRAEAERDGAIKQLAEATELLRTVQDHIFREHSIAAVADIDAFLARAATGGGE